jgi:cell division protein FtsB
MALISGLALSIVAEYYSIVGLTAIFSAAVIPTVVMGITLGLGKITATLWLKNNWTIASWTHRIYLSAAIIILMLITAMGIFGFLSKAHSDQSLVTGDVLSKIAVYDEKIKISKENIDANRKVLKQMDEALDAVLSRSKSETGADKAVSIRRSQQKERARLVAEIAAEQKTISRLSEERAPIAAEVRKVEAEVGPIKYIAQFFYGDTDPSILEKAVTWIIILIIIVFDPLAVMLLIASQVSFQKIREQLAEGDSPKGSIDVVEEQPTVTPPAEGIVAQEVDKVIPKDETKPQEIDLIEMWNKVLAAAEGKVTEPVTLPAKPYVWETTVYPPVKPEGYVQNEEQKESNRWKNITESTQITEKDYHAAVERTIDEMVDSVRKGILPFYKVPYEIQDQVKEKLQNGNETNTNNTP